DILNTWKVPGTQTSLVALKAVRGIDLEGGRVQLSLHLLDAYQDRAETIQQALRELMGALEGVSAVDIAFTWEKTPEPSFQDLLPTVKAAVVVGSGKGGVGKSTVAANLACAAARLGLKVGLLDADIYGPSMGMMFGITDGPEGTADGRIKPVEKFGLKLMSMGFLIDDDRPVVWRGPMLNKALQQFLGDVLWGELDLLFIDLPPGTGDVQITLVQNAKETIAKGGAVVVSTPQDVAFLDAKKAIGLFKVVEVPILGIVENMSSFLCPHCKGETHIFGHGGVKAAAREMDLPFLGEVPIDLEIRAGSDQGTPLVVGHPDSPQAKAFLQMARELKVKLNL
ncbi:MAG TPA: Mrp/NBP35 family ATP-binding protein, partial [Holophaga sp.]|nr:Mrp/NBP35 family ATP-binding protein [Holophaga sp.]